MKKDKHYWLARKGDEVLAYSSFPSSKEVFQGLCARFFSKYEPGEVEFHEVSPDDFAAYIAESPLWVRSLLDLREAATKKIFVSLRGVHHWQIPRATVEQWRLRLSVDVGNGKPMFHLSARHVNEGAGYEVTEDDMNELAAIMTTLGAWPPPPLVARNEAFHFRWDAEDVEVDEKELN